MHKTYLIFVTNPRIDVLPIHKYNFESTLTMWIFVFHNHFTIIARKCVHPLIYPHLECLDATAV